MELRRPPFSLANSLPCIRGSLSKPQKALDQRIFWLLSSEISGSGNAEQLRISSIQMISLDETELGKAE